MIRTQFNQALESIRMSPIVSISEEARLRAVDYEKSGKPFIRFQRGELDFATPTYIVDAIKEGLDRGLTKYPKSGGEDFYKDAVLEKLKRDHGATGLTRDNIVATYGGQEGLELSFKLFDRGAGFSPTWSCALENFVPYAQVDFEEVPLNQDFSIDYDKVDRATRDAEFFYLNNPQNPTGKVFTREELTRVLEICTRNDCFLISDEAYEKYTFDGTHHESLAGAEQENVISVFTLSKTYAMTGWRLGYVVTRNTHVAKLLRLGNYTQTAGVTTFLQFAGAEALNNTEASDAHIQSTRNEFAKRRDALHRGLTELPGVSVDKPQGAFYLFPNFTELIPRNLEGEARQKFVYRLLMEHGMATVYGSCFGGHFTDNLRFSFSATPVEIIEEGVARLREAIETAL